MVARGPMMAMRQILLALAHGLAAGPSLVHGAQTLNRPIIIAPAQFGVPKDYASLVLQLEARGHKVYVAPLRRVSWLRITPATLTPEFWAGQLRPVPTLNFFFNALDLAFAKVEHDFGADVQVGIVGHSIGGWAVRAYLGECMGEEVARRRVYRVVTLGTPHNPPPEGSMYERIDQTRGLLTYINSRFPMGSPLDAEQFVCVAGAGTSAESLDDLRESVLWDQEKARSPMLERLVALPSYLALSGEAFGVRGDGLIPVDTALLEGGCTSIVIDDCHHSGFIPTALDSLELPATYKWYGSESVLPQWADVLL